MITLISKAVGAAGANRRDDVQTVQHLLREHGVDPGPIDGLCGPRTVHAILYFQGQFLSSPDGRVDPDGVTWRRLSAQGQHTSASGAAHSLQRAASTSAHAATTSSAGQSLTTLVPRPKREILNPGLTAVSNAFMEQQLGRPRDSFSVSCQPVTNAKLKRNMTTRSVGPFSVTGLRPAVESLGVVFAQVKTEQPAVYAALGTAGMLCCRLQRGSASAISNHSWGTAVDLNLNGQLDQRGNNLVQVGLTLLAPIMNQHGWYWGAAFRTEDAMHFEGSRDLILTWRNQLT